MGQEGNCWVVYHVLIHKWDVWLTSLHRIYHGGLISLWGTLVEKLWEISFISALSRLPAVKQQPKPLVMRVHPHPEDYRSVALIGCHDFICHPLRAVLTMTEVTVFSCLLSTRCVLQNDVFVFVSHRWSPLLGHPKVFYLWKLWHWEVRDYFKPPKHFSFHFSTKLCSAAVTRIAFVARQQ